MRVYAREGNVGALHQHIVDMLERGGGLGERLELTT